VYTSPTTPSWSYDIKVDENDVTVADMTDGWSCD